MGTMESSIYSGKSVEKDLSLEFEEGDDVLSGIRQAIQQHGIRECNAVKADGQLQHATIQYFNKSKFTSTELTNGRIISCSGRFMNLKEGIYGDLHVGFMLGMQMWDGTLTKAVAKKGFQITLRFHQPINATTAGMNVEF
jgi:predicted DNA-binding protein with PD1-like motif